MEWTPSSKMSTTDLRAVLMSWGVPSLKADKQDLIDEVSHHYRLIMTEWQTWLPARAAIFSGASRGSGGAASCSAAASSNDDKSVGTDTPHAEVNYIGSDDAPGNDGHTATEQVTTVAAAAPIDDQETHQVDEAGNVIGKKNEIEEVAMILARLSCALPGCVARSRLKWQTPPKAKAVAAKDKKDQEGKAAATLKGIGKGKSKLYGGYLPMAGLFIDEDRTPDELVRFACSFRRCWQAVWQPVISCGRSYRQAAWQLVISDLGALCYMSLL